MERPFSIEDLKEGMILSKTIKSPKTGTPLLTAGQQITSKTIEALKRYEIQTVDIELSSAEMKMFEMDNDVLPTIEQWIVDSAKQSITPIRHNGKLLLNVQDVIDNAERIKSRIITQKEYDTGKLAYRLSSYKNNKTYEDKSVRIATFATVLANAYNKTCPQTNDKRLDLTEVATAALLSNYGAICQDDMVRQEIFIPEFVKFYTSLDENTKKSITEQFNPDFIPLYSFILLKDNPELKNSSVTKQMICNSRENRQGTGPLKSKQLIHGDGRFIIGSLIVSISAMYEEALTSNINGLSTLENVQSQIERAFVNKLYDPVLLELLIRNIPLYPVGTKVKLGGTDNSYAIVIENFEKIRDYHRPKVLTVPGNKEIDLRKETTITIISVVSSEVEFSKLYTQQAEETRVYRHM